MESEKWLLETTSKFNKVVEYEITYQKSMLCIHASDGQLENVILKNNIIQTISK